MSFWDSIKPAKRPAVALTVTVTPDQKALSLTFDDGHASTLTAQHLRQQCPCAECVEELTGRRVLDPAKVSADLRILEVAQVGNYAVTFVFADAHRTGIYNWKYLRQLG